MHQNRKKNIKIKSNRKRSAIYLFSLVLRFNPNAYPVLKCVQTISIALQSLSSIEQTERMRFSIVWKENILLFNDVIFRRAQLPSSVVNITLCIPAIALRTRSRSPCADPGIFVRGGGGGVQVNRTKKKQLLQCFFSPQLILQCQMVNSKENYHF